MKSENRFSRQLKKTYYLLVRGSGTPEYIARGWAIGMFYGCFIPFGFQLILSIPTAIFLRGSKIGATVGTLITNPVTIFFIYPAQCYLGNHLLGGNLTWTRISEMLGNLTSGKLSVMESIRDFAGLGWKVVAAFFLGGAIITAIMVPLTYIVSKRLVIRYRDFREKRRQQRQAEMAAND